MSASLFLVPLSIAIIVSAMEGADSISSACKNKDNGVSDKIPTRFNDENLLKQTLLEHGVACRESSANHVVADFGMGKILYERADNSSPYTMQIFDVKDLDDVVCNIKEIETEYNGNVQSYVYHRIRENLSDDMVLESEKVLEDNSILITLTLN